MDKLQSGRERKPSYERNRRAPQKRSHVKPPCPLGPPTQIEHTPLRRLRHCWALHSQPGGARSVTTPKRKKVETARLGLSRLGVVFSLCPRASRFFFRPPQCYSPTGVAPRLWRAVEFRHLLPLGSEEVDVANQRLCVGDAAGWNGNASVSSRIVFFFKFK